MTDSTNTNGQAADRPAPDDAPAPETPASESPAADAPDEAAPDAPGAAEEKADAGNEAAEDTAPDPIALAAEREEEALRQVAEAVIFAADEPVSAARIAAIYADVTGADEPSEVAIGAAVDRLNELYEAHAHAFRVEAWAGGFRMATANVMAPFVQALFAADRNKGLSRSLMETLAIVAYRQPVTRPEIEHVRGVSADYAVRKLLEMGFVDVQGRSDSLGRPLLYGTTGHFLEQFGLDRLDDLPTLREIEDLLDDPSFDRERAQLLTLQRAESSKLEDADDLADDVADMDLAEMVEVSEEESDDEDTAAPSGNEGDADEPGEDEGR